MKEEYPDMSEEKEKAAELEPIEQDEAQEDTKRDEAQEDTEREDEMPEEIERDEAQEDTEREDEMPEEIERDEAPEDTEREDEMPEEIEREEAPEDTKREDEMPEETERDEAPEETKREDEMPEETERDEAPEETEQEKEARAAEKRKTFWINFWDNVRFFAIAFLIIYVIFYIFPPYIVDGDSMNQTLKNRAFGFGFRYAKIEAGDIVILNSDQTMGKDYIKRVIAVPGDTIELIDDAVYVNGELLSESYAYYDADRMNPYGNKKVTLGDDEYFVMGDNRHGSRDSREFGAVKKDNIKCQMLFFLWGKK